MKINKEILIEHIVQKMMGKDILKENGSISNPVIENGIGMKPCDFVQFYEKPGIIVATIKGDDESSGIQQLPIGAVDNFRFMKITDENALQQFKDIANETENVKSYESILKEYESTKGRVIEQWKKGNEMAYKALVEKYGDKLLGVDIIQNDKKIQHKDETKLEKKQRDEERMEKFDKAIEDRKEGKDKDIKEIEGEETQGKEDIEEGIIRAAVGKAKDAVKNAVDSTNSAVGGVGKFFHDTFAESEATKKLITAIKDAKNSNEDEEQIKIVVSIDEKNILTTGVTVDKVLGAKINGSSLVFLTDPNEKNGENGMSLKSLREALVANKVERLSRSIDNIFCGLDPAKGWKADAAKEEIKNEKDGPYTKIGCSGETITGGDKILLIDQRSMEDITWKSPFITIKFGKTKKEVKDKEASDNLFT